MLTGMVPIKWQIMVLGVMLHCMVSNLQGQALSSSRYIEFDPPPMVWPDETSVGGLADWLKDSSFIAVKRLAEKGLLLAPDPIDSIHYEGHLSNDLLRHQSVDHLQDMKVLRALAWSFVITGSDDFAQQGIRYLEAWTSAYRPTGNDVNENKLDAIFLAYQVFYPLLHRDLRTQVSIWMKSIAERHIALWNPNVGSSNRQAKRVKLVLMAGKCLENKRLINFAVIAYQELLTTCLLPGGQTTDLERRKSMHYNINCLQLLLEVAHLIDPWLSEIYTWQTADGGSLKTSVDFMLPYASGEVSHEEWIGSQVEFDQRRAQSQDPFYQPGKLWDRKESLYTIMLASQYDKNLRQLVEVMLAESGTHEHRFLNKLLGMH